MKVTNNTQARRGVHFGGDLRWIEPGATAEGEMTPTERKRVEVVNGLDMRGDATLPEVSDDGKDEAAALKAQVAELTAANVDLQTRLDAASKPAK